MLLILCIIPFHSKSTLKQKMLNDNINYTPFSRYLIVLYKFKFVRRVRLCPMLDCRAAGLFLFNCIEKYGII